MTKPLNRDRFMKLIALAESDHDGEALAAIRKAAAMARDAGMSLGQAVGSDTGIDTTASLRATMAEMELRSCRQYITALERKLAAGADTERLEAAHVKGYQRGHKAGKAEAELEVRLEANRRIREIEAELEAYRPPLDWVPLAERFAHKNQRGTRAGFAKALLLRARTNKLTPTDQAALRKFAGPKWEKAAASRTGADHPSTVGQTAGPDLASAIRAILDTPEGASLPDREIARRLGCSPQTVGNHRRRLGQTRTDRTVTRGGKVFTMHVSTDGQMNPATTP